MPQELIGETESSELSPFRARWKENHGNLLMGFVAVILLFGSAVLAYRQTRFVPPRFPDSDMIPNPNPDTVLVGPDLTQSETLILRVTGAANDFGSIRIAIYGDEDTFNDPDRAIATNTLKLLNGEASWIVPISELPERIAISVYHDENDDEELSLNRFGIPTERYGFSRNARGLTGPPNFGQAVIDLPEGGSTVELFIR